MELAQESHGVKYGPLQLIEQGHAELLPEASHSSSQSRGTPTAGQPFKVLAAVLSLTLGAFAFAASSHSPESKLDATSGRLTADLVYLQLLDQENFQSFRHYDFPDKGDVAQKDIYTVDDVFAVKKMVIDNGYSGFSLRGHTAFMKAGPPEGPASQEDLKFMGNDDPAVFFLLVGRQEGDGSAATNLAAAQDIVDLTNGKKREDYRQPLCEDDGLQAEFSAYRFYDYPNKGDVGKPLPASEIDEAMRLVKKRGYSGFSLFGDLIFLKSVPGGLAVKDLKYNSELPDTVFYLHNPRGQNVSTPLTPSRTFYMYRAQSPAEYPFENVNAADLPGVLWYLHNEVMTLCPRKYDITRIKRMKVTVAPSPLGKRYFPGAFFAEYFAFDLAQCTTPGCQKKLAVTGALAGCQMRPYAKLSGHWYSLPGPCPGSLLDEKSKLCQRHHAGGACECKSKLGDGVCSYHYEDAGDIDLAEVTGIPGGKKGYEKFCQSGKMEYDKVTDKGRGIDFWEGFEDTDKASERQKAVLAAFDKKYPDLPLSLGPEGC